MNTIDVSIIIVNYNNLNLLDSCLDSIGHSIFKFSSKYTLSFEIIIVDNNSDGNIDSLVQKFDLPIHLIKNNENLGYAKANNQAFAVAKGKYYLLLNNDIILFPHTILNLYSYLIKNPSVTATGPRLLNRNMQVQRTAHSFPDLFHIFFETINLKYIVSKLNFLIKYFSFLKIFNSFGSYDDVKDVDCLHAACLLINTNHLQNRNKLFDERYFIYFEDTDFFYELKKNNQIVRYIPYTTAIHYHEQTTLIAPFLMYEAKVKSSLKFYKKNYSSLHCFALKIVLIFGLFCSLFFHLFSDYRKREFLRRRLKLIRYVCQFN